VFRRDDAAACDVVAAGAQSRQGPKAGRGPKQAGRGPKQTGAQSRQGPKAGRGPEGSKRRAC